MLQRCGPGEHHHHQQQHRPTHHHQHHIQERFAPELKYEIALRLAALHIHQHAVSNGLNSGNKVIPEIDIVVITLTMIIINIIIIILKLFTSRWHGPGRNQSCGERMWVGAFCSFKVAKHIFLTIH